jgi:hypothetical protein
MPMMNMTKPKGQNNVNGTMIQKQNSTKSSEGMKLTQTLALLIASASLSCASLY